MPLGADRSKIFGCFESKGVSLVRTVPARAVELSGDIPQHAHLPAGKQHGQEGLSTSTSGEEILTSLAGWIA